MSEEITQTAPAESTGETNTEATTDGQDIATSFVNGKYSSVSELESGYTNLASKFGSFAGAPEEYSMTEGVEYNAEHPLFQELQTFGKDNNMSNEGYQKLTDILLGNEKANVEAQNEAIAQVKKDLGANANERIQNIDDFVNANMEANESMKELIGKAKDMPGGVELIEAFIGMSKGTAPASEQVVAPIKTYSKDELNKMQFADDEYGNRKMASDPAYRKQVEDYHAKLLAQG